MTKRKKKVNTGRIEGEVYYKTINASKAVLWKDRQLSLPPEVINSIVTQQVKKMIFMEVKNMERWIFNTKDVLANMKLKEVGQEKQYYFSIDLAKRDKMKLEN